VHRKRNLAPETLSAPVQAHFAIQLVSDHPPYYPCAEADVWVVWSLGSLALPSAGQVVHLADSSTSPPRGLQPLIAHRIWQRWSPVHAGSLQSPVPHFGSTKMSGPAMRTRAWPS